MQTLNVLSLFDGMSCGRLALERAGLTVENYFASEIDKHAIKVSSSNWEDVTNVGDIKKLDYTKNLLLSEKGNFQVPEIDLIIAGSPCQGFSFAGKQLAFDDPRSSLYFKFEDLLNKIKPKYFLLENVRMKKEHQDTITKRLGVEPIKINSNLVSAQNRNRLYWTNIPNVIQPKNTNTKLIDVLESEPNEKYKIKGGRLKWLTSFGELKEKQGYISFNPDKAKCLTARGEPSWNTTYILQWPHGTNQGGIVGVDGKTPAMTTSSWQHNNLLLHHGTVRRLTPEECEKLQTVPVGYSKAVSDSQRYKMLGNGWTVDVIAHILGNIKTAD